jgi:hypothetical protein
MWLDAADPTTLFSDSTGTTKANTGGTVQFWKDKSTSSNNCSQASQGNAPTLSTISSNLPSLSIPTSNIQLVSQANISLLNTAQKTLITVMYVPNTTVTVSVNFGATGPLMSFMNGFETSLIWCPAMYNTDNYIAPVPANCIGIPTVIYSTYTGTQAIGYANFTNTATTTVALQTTATPLYIGKRQDGHVSAGGYLSEVIIFNTSLTLPQQQQIEGYLAQKWGIQTNLPAGNPGRTGVIYPRSPLIDSLTTGQPTRKPFIRSRTLLNYIGFTITGSTAASATNYQIPITVYRSIGTNTGSSVYLGTDIYSDYSNIYFLASNQATILTFYIESGTQTNSSARIWVSVPSIPASPSTTKVYIYWNKTGTYTSASSGTSTFPSLFDDFNGTAGSAPNASKWSVQLKGTTTSSSVQLNGSGEVILTPTDNSISSASLLSLNTMPANGFSIYIRRKYTTGIYPDTSFATTNTLVASDNALTSDWWHTTLGGGYVLFYQSPSNIVVRRQPTYTGSSQAATDIITPTISASINTYEIVEIQYSTAGVINIIWNGVNKGTATDTTFLSGGKYVLISQGNYSIYSGNVETVDYVFVRSYLNPEPSVTAWGSINTP